MASERNFRGRGRGWGNRFCSRPYWGQSRGGYRGSGYKHDFRANLSETREESVRCVKEPKTNVVKEMTTSTTQTDRCESPIAVKRQVPIEGFSIASPKLYILAHQPTFISFSEYVELGRQFNTVSQKVTELEAEIERLKTTMKGYMSPEPSRRKVQRVSPDQGKLSPGE